MRNRADGSVEALIVGPPAEVEAMLAEMRRGPRGAMVTSLPAGRAEPATARATGTFVIRPDRMAAGLLNRRDAPRVKH